MQKRLSLTLAALALCAGAAYGTGALAQSSSGGSSYGGTGSSGSSTTPGQMNSGSSGGTSTSPSTSGSSGSSAGTMGSNSGGSGSRTLTMAQAEQAGLTSAQFSALDTNHDGVLDEQELAKGGYRFRSRGG